MLDDFVPFRGLLAIAQDQLEWGTEPDTMEAAARAVAARRPASVVADSLMERAAYLRTMRGRVPNHGISAANAPLHLL